MIAYNNDGGDIDSDIITPDGSVFVVEFTFDFPVPGPPGMEIRRKEDDGKSFFMRPIAIFSDMREAKTFTECMMRQLEIPGCNMNVYTAPIITNCDEIGDGQNVHIAGYFYARVDDSHAETLDFHLDENPWKLMICHMDQDASAEAGYTVYRYAEA